MSLEFSSINGLVAELSALGDYPTEPAGRLAVIRLIGDMASDNEYEAEQQVRWLVKTMTSGIFGKWPGLLELRALFCSKFTPRDGLIMYSLLYPDGFPHQQKSNLLPAPARPTMTPEERAEYSQWAKETAEQMKLVKDMPDPKKPAVPKAAASAQSFDQATLDAARSALASGNPDLAEQILRNALSHRGPTQ